MVFVLIFDVVFAAFKIAVKNRSMKHVNPFLSKRSPLDE